MYISCLPYIKVEKESLDLHQRSVKSLLLKNQERVALSGYMETSRFQIDMG